MAAPTCAACPSFKMPNNATRSARPASHRPSQSSGFVFFGWTSRSNDRVSKSSEPLARHPFQVAPGMNAVSLPVRLSKHEFHAVARSRIGRMNDDRTARRCLARKSATSRPVPGSTGWPMCPEIGTRSWSSEMIAHKGDSLSGTPAFPGRPQKKQAQTDGNGRAEIFHGSPTAFFVLSTRIFIIRSDRENGPGAVSSANSPTNPTCGYYTKLNILDNILRT